MATLLLSAAGAAIGGAAGSSILGLSSAVIGQAIGASIGSTLDQKLLGRGSQPVQSGRMDTLRMQGSAEGAPISRVYGRMRVPGQVIWASRFLENQAQSGGGGEECLAFGDFLFLFGVFGAGALRRGSIAHWSNLGRRQYCVA